MPNADDRRIAKNTVFLYLRMLVSVVVGLYTARVVLETLGVNDFGIYSLIGGFAMIFTYLNVSISSATSRFLNFELASGDAVRLRHTFANAVLIELIIAGVLVIVAETIGLWYVNTHLNIAPERMAAANWVYQFTILTASVSVLQTPYISAILSHERMNVYAYAMIGYSLLKLGVVLLLLYCATADNLIAYAGLLFAVTLVIGLSFFFYARHQFAECRVAPSYNAHMFKSLFVYSALDMFGNAANVGRMQGTNVIINQFGGTVMNAAAGIATQITTTLHGFGVTILSASRPQIMQRYAMGDYATMMRLMTNAGRMCVMLLTVLVVPVIVEMPFVLRVWLGDVPEYGVIFARVCLLTTLGEVIKTVVEVGVQATGRLVRMSFIGGLLQVAELVLMYVLIHATGWAAVVYAVHATWIFLIVFVYTLILKSQMHEFMLRRFWLRAVLMPVMLFVVTLATAHGVLSATATSGDTAGGWLSLVLVTAVTVAVVAVLGMTVLLDKATRKTVVDAVARKFHKTKK